VLGGISCVIYILRLIHLCPLPLAPTQLALPTLIHTRPFSPPSRHSGWPPAAAAHQPLCPIFSSTSYISIHHGPALLSARSIAYQTPAPLHNTTHHHTTLAESDVKLARWPLSPPQPPVPMAGVSQVARRDCAWCLIYVRNLKNVFVGN
jgi:hypothetical protein